MVACVPVWAQHDEYNIKFEGATVSQTVTIRLTRGQRPNESQKAVIIYMMKSVGEIASKMWPVV